MTHQIKSDLIRVLRDLKTTYPSLERLEMTHQFCIHITLNEERFYVDGALVIASSLRNTEKSRYYLYGHLRRF
jgi:hypothetical protein